MRKLTLLSLFVASFLVCDVAHSQYKVGDTVVVIHDKTPITVNEKVKQLVNRGLPLEVKAVNDKWLWVSNLSAGWVNKEHVTTLENAVDIFTEQIRQNPNDWDGYSSRGLCWYYKGEIDIAIDDFNEAIRLAPNEVSNYCNRGMCWAEKGDPDKAIADYSEVIRLDPNDASARNNRAESLIKKVEFDKAISDASEAIRLNPKFSAAYALRGAAWAGKRQYEMAAADCEESLRIDPKTSAFNEVAWLLATSPDEKCRNGKKAVDFAKRSCEIAQNPRFFGTLAAAYAEIGDFDKAVEWQTKALAGASEKVKAEFQARLDLYKSGKPYRDEPKKK